MQEMKMSVSSIVGKDKKKAIYVLFSDGKRSAEGRLPDGKMISNQGFTQQEIQQLEQYLNREKNTIVAMAKNVNAMDAFLGREKNDGADGKRETSGTGQRDRRQ